MERLTRVKPDAVVLWADAEAGGHMVRRMRESGLDIPIYACDRVLHPRFGEVAGGAAEGVVAAVPYHPDGTHPDFEAFRKTYRRQYGEDPTVYAAHAYDGARMVIQAVRTGGLNRYRIRDALAELTRYEGVTGEIVMDHANSDRGPVTMATFRDGRWVYGEPIAGRVF